MLSPISIFIYWLMENSRPYGKSPEAIHRGLPNRKEKRETEKVKLELPVQNGEELGHLGPGQAGSGTEGAVSVAL